MVLQHDTFIFHFNSSASPCNTCQGICCCVSDARYNSWSQGTVSAQLCCPDNRAKIKAAARDNGLPTHRYATMKLRKSSPVQPPGGTGQNKQTEDITNRELSIVYAISTENRSTVHCVGSSVAHLS